MKNVQFITDAEGNRTAVILPIDEYGQLMEDLHLVASTKKAAMSHAVRLMRLSKRCARPERLMYSVTITSRAE
jgi:hypothetical protein